MENDGNFSLAEKCVDNHRTTITVFKESTYFVYTIAWACLPEKIRRSFLYLSIVWGLVLPAGLISVSVSFLLVIMGIMPKLEAEGTGFILWAVLGIIALLTCVLTWSDT